MIQGKVNLHKGHRKRLRERFLQGGESAFADYELLELLLFSSNPRKDVKPLAKQLLSRFGSFATVLNTDAHTLKEVEGVSEATAVTLMVVQAAANRMLREKAMESPVLSSWESVLAYCRNSMANQPVEQLRLLFLDQKNKIIADEVQQTGTVNHTPVYPREVLRRALELNACALIMVHNHPSGDPTPSRADIEVTRKISKTAESLGIQLHDHLIIGRTGYVSLKTEGLM